MDDTIDVPLDITQELIDTGEPENCWACPIVLAFQEACPGATAIEVGRLFLDFTAGGSDHTIRLPWEARNLVDAFDNGFKPAPRTLVIPIPRSIAESPGFLADETLLSPVEVEACGL